MVSSAPRNRASQEQVVEGLGRRCDGRVPLQAAPQQGQGAPPAHSCGPAPNGPGAAPPQVGRVRSQERRGVHALPRAVALLLGAALGNRVQLASVGLVARESGVGLKLQGRRAPGAQLEQRLFDAGDRLPHQALGRVADFRSEAHPGAVRLPGRAVPPPRRRRTRRVHVPHRPGGGGRRPTRQHRSGAADQPRVEPRSVVSDGDHRPLLRCGRRPFILGLVLPADRCGSTDLPRSRHPHQAAAR